MSDVLKFLLSFWSFIFFIKLQVKNPTIFPDSMIISVH